LAVTGARRGRWLLFAAVLLLATYRALVVWGTDLPLFYDQAYYYYWSLNPDWGYFSKPPMVAWLIFLTTGLFGSSELAINLGGIIAYSLTAFVVYGIGRLLYDERTGVWAGIAFACMPVVGFNSLFVSTDAPLLLFWALTILLFAKAVQQGGWYWWLGTGIAAGLGLLSKYSMGVLAVGLLAYLLADRRHRHWLLDVRLWSGLAVAALLLAPNLWWNAQHDFVSFRHTAEISQLDRELFHPARLLEFLAAQFAVFGPLFMGLFLWWAFAARSYRGDADRLMLFPALAMLGVIGLQALLSRAHMNWAAPAYVTATVFVSAVLVRTDRRRLLVWAIGINLALLSLFYHYHPIAQVLGIELRRGQTPYARVLGWRELGVEVSKVRRAHPRAALLSNSRRYLAYLSYYSLPRDMRIAWWGPGGGSPRNHYQLVADISRSDADEFLFVGDARLADADLRLFRQHEYLGERHVRVLPDLTLSVHLYSLRGFRGYPAEGPALERRD